jgi:hypothetical protein
MTDRRSHSIGNRSNLYREFWTTEHVGFESVKQIPLNTFTFHVFNVHDTNKKHSDYGPSFCLNLVLLKKTILLQTSEKY